MKTKEEILAKIENLMQEMQQLRNEVAALELVNPVVQDTIENVDKMDELACQYMQEEADSTPVIEDEVEDITLPDPPAVVYVDMPKDNKDEQPDEDAILGCKIITDLGIDYSGVCSVIKMHKLYFDNGQPKLYINKYKVVIELYNSRMEIIKSMTTHWNNLAKFHTELISRGINTHSKDNWMPKTILLDLD